MRTHILVAPQKSWIDRGRVVFLCFCVPRVAFGFVQLHIGRGNYCFFYGALYFVCFVSGLARDFWRLYIVFCAFVFVFLILNLSGSSIENAWKLFIFGMWFSFELQCGVLYEDFRSFQPLLREVQFSTLCTLCGAIQPRNRVGLCFPERVVPLQAVARGILFFALHFHVYLCVFRFISSLIRANGV